MSRRDEYPAEKVFERIVTEVKEAKPDLRAMLFDRQLQFLEHACHRKVGVIGRRGGKSTIASVALAESGLDGRAGVSFYCGITRERAKSIMWVHPKVLNAQ